MKNGNNSFTSCDPSSNSGKSNTWFTPKKIIDRLGYFDLDPCTVTSRPFETALYSFNHDHGVDGLSEEWFGRVWMNPPYGRYVVDWMDRFFDHGHGVALVFARTDAQWCQRAMRRASAYNFISGRLSFISENGNCGSNAGTGSMLFAAGDYNIECLSSIDGVVVIP